jgi:transcriptional regulator with AAA-type ATPase domain
MSIQRQAQAIARLAATNPFSDAWTALEREALGASFQKRERPWSLGAESQARSDNLRALEALTRELIPRVSDEEVRRELVLFDLYNQSIPALDDLVQSGAHKKVTAFKDMKRAFDASFPSRAPFTAAHAFAGFFQLRRAFFHTFRFIVGTSRAAARLRASVWEAIFTSDAARYRRALFDRMRDIPTLVLGETGTGKELVARAIGLSGFVPFQEDKLAFAGDPNGAFFPIHLAALSPTLVESALFGHRKGAFTGALEDRAGVFAACPPWGTVFLDEVGELDAALQTKLLRVLETRDFSAVGSDDVARFGGRVVAATNRDLVRADAGFRSDMYFRLAGIVVRTPTLRDRIADDQGELPRLVRFLATQVAGADEGDALADVVLRTLPKNYGWPGNVRELAQHVRAVLVHGDAVRVHESAGQAAGDWLDDAHAARLTADELVTAYVKHVHARVGTYEGTAKLIGLDRRTVKARMG